MALALKNLPASADKHKRCGFDPWVSKIPWRKARQHTPVSCLENPIAKGACCATVHKVTKSCTRLKGLSTHIQKKYTDFWIYICVCVCVCVCIFCYCLQLFVGEESTTFHYISYLDRDYKLLGFSNLIESTCYFEE